MHRLLKHTIRRCYYTPRPKPKILRARSTKLLLWRLQVSKALSGVSMILPTQTGGGWLQVSSIQTALALPYSWKRRRHRKYTTLPRSRTRALPLLGAAGLAHFRCDVTPVRGVRSRRVLSPATCRYYTLVTLLFIIAFLYESLLQRNAVVRSWVR